MKKMKESKRKKMKFSEVLAHLTVDDRETVIFEISQACNLDMMTVRSWAKGIRHPRRRSRERTFDVLLQKGLVSRDIELIFKD
jgi:hypothetical protein